MSCNQLVSARVGTLAAVGGVASGIELCISSATGINRLEKLNMFFLGGRTRPLFSSVSEILSSWTGVQKGDSMLVDSGRPLWGFAGSDISTGLLIYSNKQRKQIIISF